MTNTQPITDVVIIGAGLTGLSLAYYLKKAGKNVLVLEKNERVGGVINSISENGFTYETGPSTGVVGSLEIAELFEELAGECELQTAGSESSKRYIWKKTKWQALPSGPVSAVTTPLFTLCDKFRILGEPFRKAGGHPDESVADMVVRRLGKSFFDYAVDPFLSGVYAGDPHQLITRYALPKLYALEQNYGGFVRGSIKKSKEPKPANAHKVTRKVFSVKGGLGQMIVALQAEIGEEHIRTGCRGVEIAPQTDGYQITYTDAQGVEQQISAPKVVSTVGGYALPQLLPFVGDELMKPLADTTYAPVIQVAAGYKNWTGIKLDAFGGLISSKDNRKILGVLFPSAIFPNRAPEGGALLSVFMGGMRNSQLLALSDDEIRATVLAELKLTMKLENEPDLLRIHRYPHAIAQYDIKSGARFAAISAIEENYPGLILAGSFRDGIGMADRVKQAKMIAIQLIK